jgi:hypothetical protein
MEHGGKLDTVFSCLHFFHKVLTDLLTHTEIRLYVFSRECRPVQFPLTGRELPKKERHYASFIKKVLHHKDINRHNKVILFTDNIPDDLPDALHYGRLFKKNNIDFTQIIFSLQDEKDGERLSAIYRESARIADTCGGNQVFLRINDSAPVIAVECYDRYLGFLSLTTLFYSEHQHSKELQSGINPGDEHSTKKFSGTTEEAFRDKIPGEIVVQHKGGKKVKVKRVKKWQPKKIRRKP